MKRQELKLNERFEIIKISENDTYEINSSGEWFWKISNEGIKFNRDHKSLKSSEDFSLEVIKFLEDFYEIQFFKKSM